MTLKQGFVTIAQMQPYNNAITSSYQTVFR